MCWKCKEPISSELEIFRSTTCSRCGADLHSCVNCRFYEPGAHYDCHETIDESVQDKERANFCGYFSARTGFSPDADSRADKKAREARSAFDRLFSMQAEPDHD